MNPQDNEWNFLDITKHENHIAGKGFTSMSHNNLVHKFILVPQALKIRDAKAAVDKEWKKLETIPAWQMEKVNRQKEEVILEAQRDKNKVHFATITYIFHLKNAELEPKLQGSSRAPWGHCKRRLWSLRSFY